MTTYHDIIHGEIDIGLAPEGKLVRDLLSCPEVQRLRHVRLLNFDVPALQELATARRFAHAVGTCHLTISLCSRSFLPAERRRVLVASALLHDIGVPPYGHLVEAALQSVDSTFSHEALFREIVHGTYHPTNIYHQILPGQSLRVSSVLRRHGVDPDDVIAVVQPGRGASSPICADIDIDNIDNVHRMAALIGMDAGRENARKMLRHMSLTDKGEITFDSAAIETMAVWSDLRATLYGLMIGHPDCVAYNAYIQDVVRLAVECGMILPSEWYLSDRQLEERLLEDHRTSGLAVQLLQGCQYALVDYVWVHGVDDPRWKVLADELPGRLPAPPVPGARYFTWSERGKIRRGVTVLLAGARSERFGESTASLLVALISPGPGHRSAADDFQRNEREAWRNAVVAIATTIAPGLDFHAAFPENFSLGHVGPRPQAVQYELL